MTRLIVMLAILVLLPLQRSWAVAGAQPCEPAEVHLTAGQHDADCCCELDHAGGTRDTGCAGINCDCATAGGSAFAPAGAERLLPAPVLERDYFTRSATPGPITSRPEGHWRPPRIT